MTEKERSRRYYIKNKAAVTARNLAWRTKNSKRELAAARILRQKNPARYAAYQRKNHLKMKYGLTLAAYEAMLARQAGACAICRDSVPAGVKLHVDHDHATGAVRGLLCASCNLGLGKFKDSRRVIAMAFTYLTGGLEIL